MSINNNRYSIDRDKYGWVEEPPSHYDPRNSASHNGIFGWYKSWMKVSDGDFVFHRLNGPARIWEEGHKEYWLNGIYFKNIKTDEEWIIKNIIE